MRVKSHQLRVGDLVVVLENEAFPADVVLLATADRQAGSAFVETANIDGESSLKPKVVCKRTQKLTLAALRALKGSLWCPEPDQDMQKFEAVLKLCEGDAVGSFPLTMDHLALQSTVLRQTEWVIGICVYAGMQTKLNMNLPAVRHKVTRLDVKVREFICVEPRIGGTIGVCVCMCV
jgi:phospholipid-translocating ATPase